MLQATELRYRFAARSRWVLDGLSLELRPGEVLGLWGSSGEGKTTLARVLAGYLEPHAGRVLVDGSPLPKRGYRSVQLVFQHPEQSINPHFRIARAIGEPVGDVLECMEELGVKASWLSRFPHELSSGELQRVALARALGRQTRYLILDEATAMLDPISQASLWGLLLRELDRRGLGLLAISHDAALLRRVAHRIVFLRARRAVQPRVPWPREEGQ